MGKQVITANDILEAAETGNKILSVRLEDCIVTPGAWDKVEEMGIRFAGDLSASPARECPPATGSAGKTTEAQETGNSDPGQSMIKTITDQVCSLLREKLPYASIFELEALVKKVVESKLFSISALDVTERNSALTTWGGVSLINGNKLLNECTGPDLPGKVMISDAIRCHEASHLTATYMKWDKASFSRTVKSPEISIVVEGELDLIVDGKTLNAKAGDMLYMDKGAYVTYRSPSMVKLACVS